MAYDTITRAILLMDAAGLGSTILITANNSRAMNVTVAGANETTWLLTSTWFLPPQLHRQQRWHRQQLQQWWCSPPML
jgi:hypothetical protein